MLDNAGKFIVRLQLPENFVFKKTYIPSGRWGK
jgi:hypothetical protein